MVKFQVLSSVKKGLFLILALIYISLPHATIAALKPIELPLIKLPSTQSKKIQTLRLIVQTPPSTPDNATIYLTGNFPGHCKWEVDCIKLTKIKHRTYGVEIELAAKLKEVIFKVTRGQWSNQAAYSSGVHHNDQTAELNGKSTEQIYAIANWYDLSPLGIRGNLRQFKLRSPQLKKDKQISVWLPRSYPRDHDRGSAPKSFPVLYLHDGQNSFDYRTSPFGHEWSMDETVQKLIDEGKLPPLMIVSINSDEDRSAEYTFSRKGEAHALFLVNTLKPYIDKNYLSNPSRETSFLMGSSLGALITLTTLWKHSDVFSKGAGLSFPPHAQGNEIFYFMRQQSSPARPIAFYMDHGDQGQDRNYFKPVERFLNYVDQVVSPEMFKLEYQVFPYAFHNELDWARRVEVSMLWMLKTRD